MLERNLLLERKEQHRKDEANDEPAGTETRRPADDGQAQDSGRIERLRLGYDEARKAPAKQAFGGHKRAITDNLKR
jgi:hypothetical protein